MPVRPYAVRPAKAVERLMIVDALRLLTPFAPLDEYRYVGFGALEFVDFRLFHRLLGISRMESIEKDQTALAKARYEFNKPFKTVRLHHGLSTERLPDVDWDGPCVVWLDYTSKLSSSVIADLRLAAENLKVGSVLIVTLNATPEPYQSGVSPGTRENQERELLAGAVGEERLPQLSEGWSRGWGKAKVYRNVLRQEFARLVRSERGGDVETTDILSFEYQEWSESARMMTAAWLVHDSGEAADDAIRALQTLSFYRSEADNPFRINIPVLTVKERIRLDFLLPDEGSEAPDWVSERDYDDYGKVYRHCPTYMGVEV